MMQQNIAMQVYEVLSGSNRDNLYGHTMGILGTYTYMT